MVLPIAATTITQTSAITFRKNLGEMFNQVQYRQDSIVINKDGKPVAAERRQYRDQSATY